MWQNCSLLCLFMIQNCLGKRKFQVNELFLNVFIHIGMKEKSEVVKGELNPVYNQVGYYSTHLPWLPTWYRKVIIMLWKMAVNINQWNIPWTDRSPVAFQEITSLQQFLMTVFGKGKSKVGSLKVKKKAWWKSSYRSTRVIYCEPMLVSSWCRLW